MRIHNYVRADEKKYYTSIGRHVLVCHFIYICTKFFHFPDKNEKIDETERILSFLHKILSFSHKILSFYLVFSYSFLLFIKKPIQFR
jgi:hypothetical protein